MKGRMLPSVGLLKPGMVIESGDPGERSPMLYCARKWSQVNNSSCEQGWASYWILILLGEMHMLRHDGRSDR